MRGRSHIDPFIYLQSHQNKLLLQPKGPLLLIFDIDEAVPLTFLIERFPCRSDNIGPR